MNSRERMLATMDYEDTDYIPCSFMLFYNLFYQCKTETEFVEKQVAVGLDAFAHTGWLPCSHHPDVKITTSVQERDGQRIFCRDIDTPAGPLTARYRQVNGWPTEDNFPLFNDWLVGRAEEVLVKPEEDLEKVKYIFGPFTDDNIAAFREQSQAANNVAEKHRLLKVGGWRPAIKAGDVRRQRGDADGGVMGSDCMAWLSGYEEIMALSLLRPDVIKEYANIVHEWNMKQIEIHIDVADPDILFRRAWYETTEFWTPEAYRDILAPTVRREADLVHQAGKKYGYIITSAFLPVLDDMLATGIDVLVGLDPQQGKGTDLPTIKEAFAREKRTIWGGASGAMTVELGTAEETDAAVKQAIDVLGKGGGFILSPVDNVREDTENAWKNTHVFIDAWKKYRPPGR